MKLLLIALLTFSAFAADPAPKPIPAPYVTLIQGLFAKVQASQAQLQKDQAEASTALEVLRVLLCKKQKADVCALDLQHATFGRPAPATQPATAPAPAAK